MLVLYILFMFWHIKYFSGPSLAVLRIGSMEVGALLNDAFKEYEVREYLYAIGCRDDSTKSASTEAKMRARETRCSMKQRQKIVAITCVIP